MLTFFTKLAAVLVVAATQAAASSSYSIIYYSDSDCQNELGSSGGSFTSNGCLSGGGVSSVNSIWISSLSTAKIHTWSHANCNTNEWAVPVTCATSGVCIAAPGTNSIGNQVGFSAFLSYQFHVSECPVTPICEQLILECVTIDPTSGPEENKTNERIDGSTIIETVQSEYQWYQMPVGCMSYGATDTSLGLVYRWREVQG
ncbi:hypothetical protein GGX14DRAFT_408167 [Mycena pura]|uniref:Secreted protein n=1 Tax=Mycena pura TaxID=153505 RepID=A0AAD6XZW6_9AGAR|nr:hypothetical protein GGX14DRAFT_408167 [Mycena pura]